MWQCGSCREANPPAFDVCWKCGARRGAEAAAVADPDKSRTGPPCPYCQRVTEQGAVFANGSGANWLEWRGQQGQTSSVLDQLGRGESGECLSPAGLLQVPAVQGYRCSVCRCIVIRY
jgi:hypothetical protein